MTKNSGATTAVLEWAFSQGGFEIISSKVLHENIPSINLHKKLGFEYTGQSPYEGTIEGKTTEWQNFIITKQKFCGDTLSTLYQGRQIIRKDDADSLVIIQFSNNGTNW